MLAIHNQLAIAARAIPTVCGGGVFGFAGAQGTKRGAEGFLGVLADTIQERAGVLTDWQKVEKPTGRAVAL